MDTAGHHRARRLRPRLRDLGTPIGCHAYCEVYLGTRWFTFDPRFNVLRIGRVKVAHGADAVDGAFSTLYGEARLSRFNVWAYQVDPKRVTVGDPVDLTQRMDNSLTVRLAWPAAGRPAASSRSQLRPSPACPPSPSFRAPF